MGCLYYRKYAERRIMLITPCKRSAARGEKPTPSYPELRSSSTRYGVKAGVCSHAITPSYASLARGYQHLSPSGTGKYSITLHTFLNP